MRGILRSHFEDQFKVPEQVHEIAKELKSMAEQNRGTVEMLAEARALSSKGRFEGSNAPTITFDKIWKVKPDENDLEVRGFCSWSALLLHLMVHKAFGVLFNPLFRDPVMISDGILRTRFIYTITTLSLPDRLIKTSVLSETLKPFSRSFYVSAIITTRSHSTGCIRALTSLSRLSPCF